MNKKSQKDELNREASGKDLKNSYEKSQRQIGIHASLY